MKMLVFVYLTFYIIFLESDWSKNNFGFWILDFGFWFLVFGKHQMTLTKDSIYITNINCQKNKTEKAFSLQGCGDLL